MTDTDSKDSQHQPPLAPEEGIAQAAPQATPAEPVAVAAEPPAFETVAEARSGETLTPGSVPQTAEAATPTGKKRRRRRKKKPGAGADGTSTAAASPNTAPFSRFFPRGAPKKHAFATGEVIAGRVERVADGAIVLDLFGKVKAIVDADEPRDVPVFVPSTADASSAASTKPKFPREADTWSSHESDKKDKDSETTSAGMVAAPSTEQAPISELPSAATGVVTETETVAETEIATVAEVASDAKGEKTSAETLPPPAAVEDLSDADMSLLEPLAEVEAPSEGGIFRGRVGAIAESGHIAIVNREIDRAAVKKAIRAAHANKQRVQGLVYGFNRGGFDVLVGGIRAFCPASGMSLRPIDDPNEFVGKRVLFSLPENKSGKKSIVVSRRNLIEKEARAQAKTRMAELKVGDKIDGKVIDIRDYGVLVDLGGGLDGLVHLSEVSWNRGERASDSVKKGDEVKVEVLKLQPASRKDRYGRVSLSIRTCLPDPWDEAADLLKPGTAAKGTVVRTTEFGAFIRIKEGIEGLLHISELGGKDVTHAKQVIAEGADIDVIVERADKSTRRISLSKLSNADKKAIEEGTFDASLAPKSLKPGSRVNVVVTRVEHIGLRVQVQGVLGWRGRGFIPTRELLETSSGGGRGEKNKQKGPSQGSVIEVKIAGTDRDGSLRCSIKGLHMDDERKAVREYRKEAAKQGLGTFGDLLRAKLEQNGKDAE